MKALAAVVAVTAFLGFSGIDAAAQWCGGGGGGGGSSSGGSSSGGGGGSGGGGFRVPMGSSDAPKATETIVMRYYFNSEIEPSSLKDSLARVKGVEKVDVDGKTRLVNVTWSGKCRDLAQLENAAAASGVPALVLNHAHMYIAFKPLKGATMETLNKELTAINGVKGVQVSGAAAELHIDMQTVTIESLRSAAKNANFEAQLKSHQWVEAKVSGDLSKLEGEIANTKGVLLTKSTSTGLGFWAVKSVTDAMVKKAAEKVGATIDSLDRP